MNTRNRLNTCSASAALVFLLSAQMAPAQEAALLGAMVPPGATVKLDKHGTCRVITNMGKAPVMVPANTPEEWNVGQTAFLNHITAMNYLNVTACQLETSVDESTYCENSTDGVVGNCGYDAMVSGAGGSGRVRQAGVISRMA